MQHEVLYAAFVELDELNELVAFLRFAAGEPVQVLGVLVIYDNLEAPFELGLPESVQSRPYHILVVAQVAHQPVAVDDLSVRIDVIVLQILNISNDFYF